MVAALERQEPATPVGEGRRAALGVRAGSWLMVARGCGMRVVTLVHLAALGGS